MLELAKKITKNVQERLSKLTIDKPLNVLIEEEIKRDKEEITWIVSFVMSAIP